MTPYSATAKFRRTQCMVSCTLYHISLSPFFHNLNFNLQFLFWKVTFRHKSRSSESKTLADVSVSHSFGFTG